MDHRKAGARGLRFGGALGATLIGLLLTAGSLANGRKQNAGLAPQSTPAMQEQPQVEQEQLAAKDETRPAEQVYKNIQVLKGVPADQFLMRMKYFTRELGVRCEHCHVTAPGNPIPGFGAWSKDDFEAKRTARKMIQMVGSINAEYFPGKKGPTCWTCHRGSTKPELDSPPLPTPAAH